MGKFKFKTYPFLSKLWTKLCGNLDEILQNFDEIFSEKFKEDSKKFKRNIV